MARHRFDPVSLGFGLAFAYVVVLAATDRLDGGEGIGWLVPGVLAVAGATIGLAALDRARRPPMPVAGPGHRPVGAGALTASWDEPWGAFVVAAHDARQRFELAVAGTPPGPVGERLRSVGSRITAGVDEVVRVAHRGQSLERALTLLDPARTVAALARAQAELAGAPDDRLLRAEVDSLQAQLASSERMSATVLEAGRQLRVLDVRLDEAVARAVEISVGTLDESGLRALDHDVDDLVDELESLRLALDDTNRAGGDPPRPASGDGRSNRGASR